jgi:hypothetical protein
MLYYVMGYVEGESLADRLKREGRIAEPEACRVLGAIGDALQYAHDRGVVHRDVKPHNILLEAGSGRPMLTDFGISKAPLEGAALTGTGVVMGTPDFMSPEQAAGSSDVGPASDLYSLGVVAYAMLAGRLPFEGRTPGEVIAKRLTVEARPLSLVDGSVSSSLADAVMRCLVRDPSLRWPDATAFVHALAQPDDEALGPAEGAGVFVVVLGYVGLVAQLAWQTGRQPHVAVEIAAKATPIIAALVLVLALAQAWQRTSSLALALRQLFHEPAVWITWYPRSLRCRGNVWDRLPRDVRRLRLAAGGLLAGGLAIVTPLVALMATRPSWFEIPLWQRVLVPLCFLLLVPLVVGFLFFGWRIPEQLKRRGLSASEAERFAYQAPLSRTSFWSRPAVAALLHDVAAPRVKPAAEQTISSARTRTTSSRPDDNDKPTADG